MRKFLILAMLLTGTEKIVAQPKGYVPVDNLVAFKKNFTEEVKRILSIRSSFVQEKNLSVLEEKIVSEGQFSYKRDKKVRIEYLKPFRYLLIINGEQILIRDEKKETRIAAHANKLFQQINRIIVDCLNGAILENKDFSPKVFQNEKMYLLEMTPSSRAMRDFFETISLVVEKKDWSVASITLLESGGDNTLIRFVDKKINETMDDALFIH